MTKLDVYLRSIERFGATGAILVSGQPVTLKLPGGDRQAQQVTPHDQLVVLVREVAPPAVLDQIDAQRAARFDVDSEGRRYTLSVTPRPGAWMVAIDQAVAAPAPVMSAAARAPARPAGGLDGGLGGGGAPAGSGEMEIERGQYDAGPVDASAPSVSSGTVLLDSLTTAARASRATDIFLSAGAVPLVRAGGELSAVTERGTIDGDVLSRELGVVAPTDVRAAWSEGGHATFAYGDGAGRVRVVLTRDQRGVGAALRLLHAEPPALGGLGLDGIARWLDGRGLIVIAGPAGAGKTTVQAAIVRALGERRRLVVSIEDPIEMVQASPSISQRAVREHVATIAEGIAGASHEGVDAISVCAVHTPADALAVLDAVAAGHLVVTTITAPPRLALERLIAALPAEHRELGRAVFAETLLGTVAPQIGAGGARTVSVLPRGTAA